MIARDSWLLYVCLLIACPAWAASPSPGGLAQIAQQLQVHEQLRGDFEQRKQLHFMNAPLLSYGNFSLDDSLGLNWTVTRPVRSHMQVHNGRVTLDGKPVRDRGVGQFMAQIMQAFMSGDLQRVEKDFSAQVSTAPDGWHLQLLPRSPLLRAVIRHIDLQGRDVLQRIAIFEDNGNETYIVFSNVSEAGAAAQVQDTGDS